MATAKTLNESYQNFLETREVSNLLVDVRCHVISEVSQNNELNNVSEDLAQDVVIAVWRSIDPKCPSPRSPFKGESSFSTWLTTVINTFLFKSIRDSEEYISVGTSNDLTRYTEGDDDENDSDE